VGFDDVPQAAWPSYELTTHAQPLPEMIEAVMKLLSVQLQGRDQQGTEPAMGQSIILQGHMRLRGSVRINSA
jgi:DNA-binding LacI/PurR family transcriptional regulator